MIAEAIPTEEDSSESWNRSRFYIFLLMVPLLIAIGVFASASSPTVKHALLDFGAYADNASPVALENRSSNAGPSENAEEGQAFAQANEPGQKKAGDSKEDVSNGSEDDTTSTTIKSAAGSDTTAKAGTTTATTGSSSGTSSATTSGSSSGTSATTSGATATTTNTTTPTTVEETTTTSILYRNCGQAQSSGALPLYVGDPGYGLHLDRDGDGEAC